MGVGGRGVAAAVDSSSTIVSLLAPGGSTAMLSVVSDEDSDCDKLIPSGKRQAMLLGDGNIGSGT